MQVLARTFGKREGPDHLGEPGQYITARSKSPSHLIPSTDVRWTLPSRRPPLRNRARANNHLQPRREHMPDPRPRSRCCARLPLQRRAGVHRPRDSDVLDDGGDEGDRDACDPLERAREEQWAQRQGPSVWYEQGLERGRDCARCPAVSDVCFGIDGCVIACSMTSMTFGPAIRAAVYYGHLVWILIRTG